MNAAGVKKDTPRGRLDFHAVRKTFISLFEDPAVSPTEVQELALHSNLDLTINAYGEAREDRLPDAVTGLFEVVVETEFYVPFMYGESDHPEKTQPP